MTTKFGVPTVFVEGCINLFGVEGATNILVEECSELIKAICKLNRLKDQETATIDELIQGLMSLQEELSHVLICCAQVGTIYNIDEQDVMDEVLKKALKYDIQVNIVPEPLEPKPEMRICGCLKIANYIHKKEE